MWSPFNMLLSYVMRFYYFVADTAWKCRGERVEFFLVDDDGDQHPLEDDVFTDLLVAIHYTKKGTRYRFREVDRTRDSPEAIKSAFKTYDPLPYSLYGIMVTSKDHQYTLNAPEFALTMNKLFTAKVNLWLCKNYLHIPPVESFEVTIIGPDIAMQTYLHPVVLTEERIVELAPEEAD